MIEIKDGINWNNFLAELKPESWYKRKSNEGNVDWIKRVAIKDSNWLEEAKERQRNEYWKQESLCFVFSIHSFLRQNNLKLKQMEDDLNMEIDLSGDFDYKMSEICKIKNYILNYD